MYHNLKNNSIFVADSHFNKKNKEFLTFLKKLNSREIVISSLILMGDNFDFISGESKYFIKINKEVIDLLNELSLKIEIIYLEGNHDYNLQNLFKNIKVIKRDNQPFLLKGSDEQTIAISHGDNFINWKYDLYCFIIRNKFLLKFLNMIDFNNFISKKIERALLNKQICHRFTNFESLVIKRLKNYDTNIVIEGHYHQGDSFFLDEKYYINVPSLCCSKDYLRYVNGTFLKESL